MTGHHQRCIDTIAVVTVEGEGVEVVRVHVLDGEVLITMAQTDEAGAFSGPALLSWCHAAEHGSGFTDSEPAGGSAFTTPTPQQRLRACLRRHTVPSAGQALEPPVSGDMRFELSAPRRSMSLSLKGGPAWFVRTSPSDPRQSALAPSDPQDEWMYIRMERAQLQ